MKNGHTLGNFEFNIGLNWIYKDRIGMLWSPDFSVPRPANHLVRICSYNWLGTLMNLGSWLHTILCPGRYYFFSLFYVKQGLPLLFYKLLLLILLIIDIFKWVNSVIILYEAYLLIINTVIKLGLTWWMSQS
jgi:hypothetical protein